MDVCVNVCMYVMVNLFECVRTRLCLCVCCVCVRGVQSGRFPAVVVSMLCLTPVVSRSDTGCVAFVRVVDVCSPMVISSYSALTSPSLSVVLAGAH